MRSVLSWFAAPLAGALLLVACQGDSGGGEGGSDEGSDAEDRIPAALIEPERADLTAPDSFDARFETTAGEFVVRVHRDWAPRGADRFFNLVQLGYYDSVYVHRVVPGRVAQFGIHPDPRINYRWSESPIRDDPVQRSNERGRVTFARSGRHSRTTQVFVNLGDNSSLDDEGFAPFGEVVDGMEVVDELYDGYGDGPPRGEGPYPARAAAEGNEYFEREFPELDQILRVTTRESR